MNEKTLEDQLYRTGWLVLGIGFPMIFMYLHFAEPGLTFPCLLLSITGFYCPGCGGTRALEAFLRGRFLLSLWYHPLVVYGAVIITGFMGTHTLERLKIGRVKGWKFHSWYLYGALAVVAGNWILKNILLLALHITL